MHWIAGLKLSLNRDASRDSGIQRFRSGADVKVETMMIVLNE